MQYALRALIENYCATLSRQVNEIGDLLGQTNSDTCVLAPLGSALDVVHQISGLSGTMGFTEVGTSALELEQFMRRFVDDGRIPSVDDLAVISTLFKTLSQRASGVEPVQSTLYHADLSGFAVGVR